MAIPPSKWIWVLLGQLLLFLFFGVHFFRPGGYGPDVVYQNWQAGLPINSYGHWRFGKPIPWLIAYHEYSHEHHQYEWIRIEYSLIYPMIMALIVLVPLIVMVESIERHRRSQETRGMLAPSPLTFWLQALTCAAVISYLTTWLAYYMLQLVDWLQHEEYSMNTVRLALGEWDSIDSPSVGMALLKETMFYSFGVSLLAALFLWRKLRVPSRTVISTKPSSESH